MSFSYPETTRTDGNPGEAGAFRINALGIRLCCIAAKAHGWEHVSVRAEKKVGKNWLSMTPQWFHMCAIKKLFWDKEDCVVQFHPPESEYVNCHPNVLHLWRSEEGHVTPPKLLV
jgi:hypothetical protein